MCFLDKYKPTMINLGLFLGVNTFWVVQNNKTVINIMSTPNKHRKVNAIANFNFSNLYTKLG